MPGPFTVDTDWTHSRTVSGDRLAASIDHAEPSERAQVRSFGGIAVPTSTEDDDRLRGPAHRSRVAVASALFAGLVLNGCGGGSDAVSFPPHAAPTGAGGCNDLPQVNLDPGVVSGFNWSGEKHAFSDAVTIYACVDPKGGGEMTLEALPAGVSVDPTVQPIAPAGNGLLPFRIRVQSGAAGTFHLLRRIDGETIGPQSQGPTIVSDANGWHFVTSP